MTGLDRRRRQLGGRGGPVQEGEGGVGVKLDVRHEHTFSFRPDGTVRSFACRCLLPQCPALTRLRKLISKLGDLVDDYRLTLRPTATGEARYRYSAAR